MEIEAQPEDGEKPAEPVAEEIGPSLQDMAGEAPVVRLVNSILDQAVREGASDIHISPMINTMQIRFRIDGKAARCAVPPKSLALPIITGSRSWPAWTSPSPRTAGWALHAEDREKGDQRPCLLHPDNPRREYRDAAMRSSLVVAIAERNLGAVGAAIAAMLVVILIYDQLLFRPLVAWADRFRFEQEASAQTPRSWVLTILRKSKLVTRILAPFSAAWRWSYRAIPIAGDPKTIDRASGGANWMVWIWYLLIIAAVLVAVRQIVQFVTEGVPVSEIATVGLFGLATMARVFVLIAIASAIWVPVGVWIGLRPNVARVVQPIAQFLAAFPANLLFPIAVSAIVVFRLDPNIWLSPLMILGTQWYILFNVIAGASAVPSELRHIGANLQVRGWLWWRRIGLPAVFPFYVTGAITASGGSWNASIVAEVASWGDDKLQAYGLGAYIAQATAAGDFHRIVLGIAVMSAFVTIINRAFWRPLYYYAERKFRLG